MAPRTPKDGESLAAESAAAAGVTGAGLIVGSAVGGGPVGAIAGAAMGPSLLHVFRRVGAELATRGIGRRQSIRIGLAGKVALEQIAARLERGEEPRAGFLNDGPAGRSTAEELLEEATRVAGESADERKAPLLGWVYASLLFTEEMTDAHARYLHVLVERLTYRQLVALVVVGEAVHSGQDPFMERYHEIIDAGNYATLPSDAALEMDDLADLHLIGVVERAEKRKDWVGHDPKVSSPYGLWGGDSPDSIWQQSVGRVRATPIGRQLAALYGDGVDAHERESWLQAAWRMVLRED